MQKNHDIFIKYRLHFVMAIVVVKCTEIWFCCWVRYIFKAPIKLPSFCATFIHIYMQIFHVVEGNIVYVMYHIMSDKGAV